MSCLVSSSVFSFFVVLMCGGISPPPPLSTKSSVGCFPIPLVAHGVERTELNSSLLYRSVLFSRRIERDR